MIKVRDLISHLEQFAPSHYQESYDNAGLIVGDPEMEIKGVLICLDSTEAVLEEAIRTGCNVIVAHHPIVFSGLKKINGKNYVERVIIKAIQHNLAIYAAHTNADNVAWGVNSEFARQLGLINTTILSPKKDVLRKLVTFVPHDHADKVMNALFTAGAGNIGHYDECSFSIDGTGTFRGKEGSDPFIGTVGVRESVAEKRVEVIFENVKQSAILKALFAAHPYEEVAYDIYSLVNDYQLVGSGMIGELPAEMPEMDFLKLIREKMKAGSIRHTEVLGKKVKKVAICGGSGSFLLNDAIRAGADVFVTADFKYHQFFDADGRILIADIGHYESEQYTIRLFYEVISKKFTTFAVRLTEVNTNPVKYM